MKRMKGMLTGIMLGATAVSLYGMASSKTQRRLHRAASHAGRQIVSFAESMLGR